MKTIIIRWIRLSCLLGTLLLSCSFCSRKAAVNSISSNDPFILTNTFPTDTNDITSIYNLPPIGKWMYKSDLSRADWLGLKYESKTLYEPINIIVRDNKSTTAEEALRKFEMQISLTDFKDLAGHSSGYAGFIGSAFYKQLPSENTHAFSDENTSQNNNHGRFFGPCSWDGGFYFTGAMSRELFIPSSSIRHHFDSFLIARDRLADEMNNKTVYKITGQIDLNNAITNDSTATTGDHDGVAVLLDATE